MHSFVTSTGKKKAAPPKLSETIQKLREALVSCTMFAFSDCGLDVSQEVLDKREKHLVKQVNAAIQEAKAKSKLKDKRGMSINAQFVV